MGEPQTEAGKRLFGLLETEASIIDIDGVGLSIIATEQEAADRAVRELRPRLAKALHDAGIGCHIEGRWCKAPHLAQARTLVVLLTPPDPEPKETP